MSHSSQPANRCAPDANTDPKIPEVTSRLLDEFERFIQRDPARRGLCGSEIDEVESAFQTRLAAGQLAAASFDLAQRGRKVAIVTGFFIPHAQPPSAETDGPPGSLFLAALLDALGMETCVITDSPCAAALRAAADGIDYPRERLAIAPLQADEWCSEFLRSEWAQGLTHLIAVERVGPSHTPGSVTKTGELLVASWELSASLPLAFQPSALSQFLTDVAVEHHNRCHNMRGVCIDAHTAPLHLLFERLPDIHPAARTIGIGDGGNEIGMGSIPWYELRRRLSGDHAGRIPCRIACDFHLVAGTSNWGAMALAAAVCWLRDRRDLLTPWTSDRHQQWLQHLVDNGPAVDGVTGRREATVDGLPFLTYIQPWEGVLRLCEATNRD